jgi:hypothetical protein
MDFCWTVCTKEEQRSVAHFLWAEGGHGAQMHIYVLRMGTVLFLRDFMQVDRIVQGRLDKCDLMLNAQDSPQHVPAVRN